MTSSCTMSTQMRCKSSPVKVCAGRVHKVTHIDTVKSVQTFVIVRAFLQFTSYYLVINYVSSISS